MHSTAPSTTARDGADAHAAGNGTGVGDALRQNLSFTRRLNSMTTSFTALFWVNKDGHFMFVFAVTRVCDGSYYAAETLTTAPSAELPTMKTLSLASTLSVVLHPNVAQHLVLKKNNNNNNNDNKNNNVVVMAWTVVFLPGGLYLTIVRRQNISSF